MISNTQLDEKLEQWRREYGSGDRGIGFRSGSVLSRLIDHQGEVPESSGFAPVPRNTAADDVEHAVNVMLATIPEGGGTNPYFRAAMVLRAEHLTPNHWPETERLRALARIGIDISRHTYYRSLQFGRAFLMGYFSKERAKAVA